MIRGCAIENFKSLMDFKLPSNGGPLGKFTCLIGLNGAGKSTLLQALDFYSQLIHGEVSKWLEAREWKANDLLCSLVKKQLITFSVTFDFGGKSVIWEGKFNPNLLRCTAESIRCNGEHLMRLSDGNISIGEFNAKVSQLNYQGSLLSILNPEHGSVIWEVKNCIYGLKSLEMLSPHLMRKKSRQAKDVGVGGEKLSAFLYALSREDKESLGRELHEFYESIESIHPASVHAGWKKLSLKERFKDAEGVVKSYPFDATHISDGVLRVLAILSQAKTHHDVILFDEIENGINPELVGKVVDFLIKRIGKQVFVTTHSPLILNFLPDEVARESVFLIYKTERGDTRCTRFFDIPEVCEKLDVLGPGEVYMDTFLQDVVRSLEQPERALSA